MVEAWQIILWVPMGDESHCRWVFLADLATDKGEEVLGVLQRGTIHDVLWAPFQILHTLTGLFRAHRGNSRPSAIMCLGA
uniref:Uncharacterized protein n=1 Tax=Rhizophora mucronata TaxID=61149 RepID=A0A2P2JSV5_RHIMU